MRSSVPHKCAVIQAGASQLALDETAAVSLRHAVVSIACLLRHGWIGLIDLQALPVGHVGELAPLPRIRPSSIRARTPAPSLWLSDMDRLIPALPILLLPTSPAWPERTMAMVLLAPTPAASSIPCEP